MKKILITLLVWANLFGAGQVGDKAVGFDLPNLYNLDKKISLNEYKGKVVLVNLWASWCGGCQEEMPIFVELQKEFKGSDFHILLSTIDKEPKNAVAFLQSVDRGRVLKSVYDSEKILPKAYRCIGMPSSYLVDKSGTIVEVYVGSIDEKHVGKLKAKIKSLLGE